jgi:hypothetical protein
MNLFSGSQSMFIGYKRLLIGLSTGSFLLCLLFNTRADPDLWGYLAFGRLFWTSGEFPYQDVFAYVPTKENWIYHEWLTGVLFYPIYNRWGGTGLQLLKYMLGLLTAVLVYLTARKRGANPLVTVVALLCVGRLFHIGYSPVRAQIFTYLFFVVYIYILEMTRRDQCWRRLYWLVPIQVMWTNFHGGFLAGPGLLGLYALGECLSGRRCWAYVTMLTVCGPLTLINPYGIDYWKYIIEAVSMDRPEIWEWHSVLSLIKKGYPHVFYLDLLLTLFLSSLFLVWYRKRDLTDILVLAVTAYLGLRHFRHQVFFLLAFGVYMPVVFTVFLGAIETHQGVVNFRGGWGRKALVLLLGCLTAFFAHKFVSNSPFSLRTPPRRDLAEKRRFYYPIGAIEYIKTHNLKGNILPQFSWGEFIIWTLYPQCRVAMDGRYETVYQDDLCMEFWDFQYGRDGWQRFLSKHPHDMVVIKSNSTAHKLLQAEPGWKEAYVDAGCVVFLRQTTDT